jgi:hypothetical protein
MTLLIAREGFTMVLTRYEVERAKQQAYVITEVKRSSPKPLQ